MEFGLACGCLLAAIVVITNESQFIAKSLAATAASVAPALPVFTDITRQSGLTMKIVCGDEESKYLTEVNGEGACFLDYNNDGYQDIYLVNGSSSKLEAAGRPPHDYLLRNNGDGTFTDVTRQAHLGDTGWHGGCAVGDYNNDGYTDLYVTGRGPNKLYRNNGDGTFTDVSEAAGVGGPHWDVPKWSMGAAFGDYDNDGYLDLYVTNFVKLDPQHPGPRPDQPNACVYKGVPIACPPDDYEGQQAILYHNNGNGTFTDVTQAAGLIRQDPGRGFGVVFGDFANHGLQDIFQVNDVGSSFFYINNGDGTFKDASFDSGLAVDGFGNIHGTMGVTVGDYDNDGLLDVFVANWIREGNTLYKNQGGHVFEDVTETSGLSHLGFEWCGWGTKFFDFDNDGWLDLWITFGHTNEQVEKVYPQESFAEPNYLLRNEGGKQFVNVSAPVGLSSLPKRSGRGAAFADIDNDGDIDVLVINKNEVPILLRNDGGNRNNWLMIRTEGVKSNRSGIGARITVTAGGSRRIFEVRSSESYLSGNDLRVHVGMGDQKQADAIDIRWSRGQVDHYTNVAVNTFYLAREGSWLKPDTLVASPKKTVRTQ
jgi:enediyne biosynthesis protein E4